MDFPRTGKPLKAVKVGGIKVDISEGCGGIWLDNHEFQKFTSASSEGGGNKPFHVGIMIIL